MIKFKWKINLINLTPESLSKLNFFLRGNTFIYKQVLNWLYNKNIENIFSMLNIKFYYRVNLDSISNIIKLKLVNKFISSDNTVKFALKLFDGNSIEAVLIPNRKNHFTLCVSSQVGCMLNCSFCYTGKIKFKKNLRQFEILSQLLLANSLLSSIFKNKLVTNLVFMGMGEPLLNINNVLASIQTVVDFNGLAISKNKITVSTSGIIDKFAFFYNSGIRLALSLHAANDLLRTKLMPINKKYSLHKILDQCKIFLKKDLLTIEYVMLKDVNDSIYHAYELFNLLIDIKCKVCLIPFNYFVGSFYDCSDKKVIVDFKNFLKSCNIIVTIRKSFGVDIYGACGQLAGKI